MTNAAIGRPLVTAMFFSEFAEITATASTRTIMAGAAITNGVGFALVLNRLSIIQSG